MRRSLLSLCERHIESVFGKSRHAVEKPGSSQLENLNRSKEIDICSQALPSIIWLFFLSFFPAPNAVPLWLFEGRDILLLRDFPLFFFCFSAFEL